MIEIKKTSGSGLQYPIEQITLLLTNANLQSLNSSPFELLPAGYNYNVLNVYLEYDNVNLDPSINLFIGYASLLSSQIATSFVVFDTTYMALSAGNIGLDTRITNFDYANSLNIEPLVIWQQADNSSANYNLFKLTITYIKFP